MSVVVLAYHEMGCMGLRVLIEEGVKVSAVFTHEDDPGENHWFGSVADLARRNGIPVFMPSNINRPGWAEMIHADAPDVIFSFYYRRLIKRTIWKIPRYGSVNLHGSLLPKYRGRCPVNWQLINGETESGITLHYIVSRADAGDIIAQERVAVGADDTALVLYRKLLAAGEKALRLSLRGILNGTAPRVRQEDSQATVFGGRRPEHGRIDWRRSAREIHNLVRAVAPPWPGAFSETPAGKVMIWSSRPHVANGSSPDVKPGEVQAADGRVFVGTGEGILELLDYETADGRPLTAGKILGRERAAISEKTP